jgi:hypothetical protein
MGITKNEIRKERGKWDWADRELAQEGFGFKNILYIFYFLNQI